MNAEVEKAVDDEGERPQAESTEPKFVLCDPCGNIVFTSRHARPYDYESGYSKKMAALWPQVLREAFNADVLGKNIAITHQESTDVDFRGMDLSDITFAGSSFRGADLRDVCLTDANLESCSFGGALMQNADVNGAELHGADFVGVQAYMIPGIIIMGELDGYLVWAYPTKAGKHLRIRAGCRDFSLKQARAHWEGENGRVEIYKSLDFIEFMAKRLDWNPESPALDEEDDD